MDIIDLSDVDTYDEDSFLNNTQIIQVSFKEVLLKL
jgi:hypothetical protein